MPLQWIQELSVHNQELDDHHKSIISIVNELDDAVRNNRGTQAAAETISELADDAAYHFGAEEALFEIKHYPQADEHVEQHLLFRERLGELEKLIVVGDNEASAALRDFLFTWWTHHILTFDKKYVSYLKD